LLYLAVFRQIIGKSKVLFTFISKIIKNPAIMKINLQRIDDAFNMRATDELGHEVFMDSSVENGGKNKGVRPMAMLIMGMGGCAAIDVVMIVGVGEEFHKVGGDECRWLDVNVMVVVCR